VTISALGYLFGVDSERRQCPIRALRFYLNATASDEVTQGTTSLFLPWREKTRHVKPSMISKWLTTVIHMAYNNTEKDEICDKTVTAHEIGALATSWAYVAETPLQKVLAAASWKHQTTFTTHYFRNPRHSNS
jgi:hypothetical protein